MNTNLSEQIKIVFLGCTDCEVTRSESFIAVLFTSKKLGLLTGETGRFESS